MKKIIRITTVPVSLKVLLKEQLKFMKQYFDIIAVSSDGDCFEEMIKEQEVRGVKINMTRKITPIADLVSLCRLIILFTKERPEIVHSHTPKAGLLGMMAAWITRVPVRMHTVAGLPLLVHGGKKRKLLEFVEKLTYYCSTNVYPNSFRMKDIIINLGLCQKEKLKVIGNGSSNGIDLDYFSKTDEVLTEAEQYKKDDVFTFCFIGRIVKDKGINELISAFIRLYSENKNIRLLLVGSFEKKLDPVLSETEDAINNHEAIEFVGFQKDVRPFLLASDALAFPSYREGFPNVVLQAGAMGLPSIVTDINGCNEIIEDGVNGVIIPPKDTDELYNAMKRFVMHNDWVKSMADVAREKIAIKYDRKVVWEALLEEYKRALGE